MPDPIQIRSEVLAKVLKEVHAEADRECCGLLAGRDGAITRALPATNVSGSPATAYEIAPMELFRLMREIRADGLELLGIYHSHPTTENAPSARDIEQAYYPDAAYFILSPRRDAADATRAFVISDGRVTELQVEVI